MNISNFKKLPILGILRGVKKSHIKRVFQESIGAGLTTIEITLNTPFALNMISTVTKEFSGGINIGAGTVLSVQDAEKAIEAGATFIVAPNFNKNVANYCLTNNISYFPGALTPTEIQNAWENGATMVKLFPANLFGPQYLKDVKGPLNKIEIMAVNGVKPDNLISYFENGASAIGIGSSVFRKEWLEGENWDLIRNSISKYIEKYKEYKNK